MNLLALNSGGIDSPVATNLMLERGFSVDAIVFDNQPFSDQKDRDLALKTLEKLSELHNTEIKAYILPHGFIQEKFLNEADEEEVKYSCLFSRRTMMRAASRIAGEDYRGLVTGENLAQVASQTLDNLVVIDESAGKEVIRPLLTWDKEETVNKAKEIGTYDLSIQGGIVCASNPDYPETHGAIKDLKELEKKFEIEKLVKKSIKDKKVKELS
ncbi:MAG: hypothetical protein MUP58_02710 [Candidatus Nanohaloarchaeota archaeon QJJ-9]|nr:hypothetical protein [Candidatus Nanohaloarchaeota archaeon QJJ-9]